MADDRQLFAALNGMSGKSWVRIRQLYPMFQHHKHSIFHINRFSQNMNAVTANLDVEGIGEEQKSVGVLMSPQGVQRS